MAKFVSTSIDWKALEIGSVLTNKKDTEYVIVKKSDNSAFVVNEGKKRTCEVSHYSGKHLSYYGVFEIDDNGDEGWVPLVTSAWRVN